MKGKMIPKIIVKKVDCNTNATFITRLLTPEFTENNSSLPFEKYVYGLLPELAGRIQREMTSDQIYEEVYEVVAERFRTCEAEMELAVSKMQEAFDQVGEAVTTEMLEIFQLEWPEEQGEIVCYMGCYPVFPRDVMTKAFWVNYSTPQEHVMGASIHEINHFVAFEKWKAMHGYDKPVEPTHPEPLWFLEEIIVDPTLNEPQIQAIVSYPQQAYKQFYKERVGGVVVMEHIKKLYEESGTMAEFLDAAYEYIEKNSEEMTAKCG